MDDDDEIIVLSDSDEGIQPNQTGSESITPMGKSGRPELVGLNRNPSGQSTLAFTQNVRKRSCYHSGDYKPHHDQPQPKQRPLAGYLQKRKKEDEVKISISGQGSSQVKRTEVKIFLKDDHHSKPKIPKTARKTLRSFAPNRIPVAGDTSEPELVCLSEDEEPMPNKPIEPKIEPKVAVSDDVVKDNVKGVNVDEENLNKDQKESFDMELETFSSEWTGNTVEEAIALLCSSCCNFVPQKESEKIEKKLMKKMNAFKLKNVLFNTSSDLKFFINEKQKQIETNPTDIYVYLKEIFEHFADLPKKDGVFKEEELNNHEEEESRTSLDLPHPDTVPRFEDFQCTSKQAMEMSLIDIGKSVIEKPEEMKKEKKDEVLQKKRISLSQGEVKPFSSTSSTLKMDDKNSATTEKDEPGKKCSEIKVSLTKSSLAKKIEGDEKKKVSTRHIRKLEKALKLCDREIQKLEEAECDLDDEFDSNYIKIDRYKRKFISIYKKIAELQGYKADTGRQKEKRFRFSGSRNLDINDKVEKFINKQKKKNPDYFPDFADILSLVKSVYSLQNLNCSKDALIHEAKEIFTAIGNKLKKRRVYDDVEVMESYEKGTEKNDPALSDPDMRNVLEENMKLGKQKMEDVCESFVRKQIVTGEEAEEVPDNEIDGDEYEEEEEEIIGLKSINEKRKEASNENEGQYKEETKNPRDIVLSSESELSHGEDGRSQGEEQKAQDEADGLDTCNESEFAIIETAIVSDEE